MGRWFEISKLPAQFEKGRCIETNFSMKGWSDYSSGQLWNIVSFLNTPLAYIHFYPSDKCLCHRQHEQCGLHFHTSRPTNAIHFNWHPLTLIWSFLSLTCDRKEELRIIEGSHRGLEEPSQVGHQLLLRWGPTPQHFHNIVPTLT